MKTLFFDLFGTVFDIGAVATNDELTDYARQVHENQTRHNERGSYFQPLILPKHWGNARPFWEAKVALAQLQHRCHIVTLSNAPLWLQCAMCRNFWCGLRFDAIVPLDAADLVKPQQEAYAFACEIMDIKPQDAVMVTANEKFGDLEQAAAIGMETHLVGTKERWEELVRKYG